MTSQTLSIASTSSIPQARAPHLMPFHVAHTGPAPVNAYFRPRAAISGTPGAPSVAVSPEDNSAVAEEKSQAETPSIATSGNPAQPSRQTATFRGRALHSLPVTLPEGYTGVILRGGAATAPSKPKPASRSRSRRRTADEDVEMKQNGLNGDESGNGTALNATGRFDSITLWHPDIPADDGRDEYVRSLREWVALAAEVHKTEDD
ncbi:hypothetical protein PENSPDRAFT_756836 [Peniophora sp. CONT]|nr:hypothetical protein PENSPDRAFT_756836 [Peniophora sp. CONT]